MGPDRRALLKAVGAGGLALGTMPLWSRLAREARAASQPRPRFYLQIIPLGGMDPVYSTDPKTTDDVVAGIEVPYPKTDIVEAGNVRFGPMFKGLAPWASRLAVVNMFRQNSANHQSGVAHATRCKSHTTWSTPTLLDVLGSRRTEEAVGAISIGAEFGSGYSPQYFGEPGTFFYGTDPTVLDHLDGAEPDDLRTLARVYKKRADELGVRKPSPAERVTAENLRASASLFERTASSPKFQPVVWQHAVEERFKHGRDIQRALWLFENKLARCVTIYVGKMLFDTHTKNAPRQTMMGEYVASLIDHLIKELDARKLDGQPMAELTAVFMGSEIGRFPRLNAANGKDHFPQAPYTFIGPWFKTGATYGGTDREFITVPVSLATGKPDKSGRMLYVDDIGRTLLRLDGANPEVYGYSGANLDFLVHR